MPAPLRLFALFSLMCPGCGIHKGSSTPAVPLADIGTVNVTDSNQTHSVSDTGTWNLNVDGSSDIITVVAQSQLHTVTLSGTGNDLSIGPSSTVSDSVFLNGVDCILHLPLGSTIVVHKTGTGNQVVYDSSAG